MANGAVDAIVPGGGGPGKEFAKLSKHVLPLGLYLSLVTLGLLACLIWQWPHCETDSCMAGNQSAGGSTTPPPSGAVGATGATGSSAPAVPVSGVAAASTETATAVVVSSLDPASGPIGGGTTVRIAGSGFLQESSPEVRFGGVAGKIVSVEKLALTVTTPMHAEGQVDVGVKVGKEKEATLSKGFTYVCPERTQNKLLLLVVLAGALGSVLHAGRSLFTFVGNRNLRVSWLWMYYLLPLNGAVVGILFFLVMLAGLFSVQGNTAQTFLLTIGVAAIVGMFSQQAVEKLKQISEAILTKLPPSADQKPTPLTLAAVTPPQGPTAGGTAVVLTGTGFASGATVTFGGATATGVKVACERIDAVTPPHAAGKVDVEVCNPDSGMAKKAAAFEYVDAPPPASGTPVQAGGGQAAATGGQVAAALGPGAVGPGTAPAAGGTVPVAGVQGQAAGNQPPATGASSGQVGGSTTAAGGVGGAATPGGGGPDTASGPAATPGAR